LILQVTLVVIMVLLPLAGLAQPARDTAPSTVAQLESAIQSAIAKAEPSVVAISRTATPAKTASDVKLGSDVFAELRATVTPEATPPVIGAGVIIDKSGLVLTQYLTVHDGDQHFVTTTDRETYPAAIRAADSRSGLAILAINLASPLQRAGTQKQPSSPTFHPITIADADRLRKGNFVIAIGNPFAIKSDGQATVSWGTVTNLAQKATAGTNLNDAPGTGNDYRTTLHHLGTLIQTDAKLGWSTGGGALVNMQGELMGLTTTAATIAGHEQPAGYAIPMNAVFRRVIETMKAGREVEYGMLGVGFGQQLYETAAGRTSRLTLMNVYPGTPAAQAGLEMGDAVTKIGETPVSSVDDVQLAVSILPPNTATTVAYVRNGQPATAPVTVAKLAPPAKNVVTVRADSWHGLRVDYPTALPAIDLAQAINSGTFDPQGCVLVSEVQENSDAWKAGIRQGMFIREVGGSRVTTPAEFHAAARKLGVAFDVQLTKPVDSEIENEVESPDAGKPK
jgi:S1-C subfamily serine protease